MFDKQPVMDFDAALGKLHFLRDQTRLAEDGIKRAEKQLEEYAPELWEEYQFYLSKRTERNKEKAALEAQVRQEAGEHPEIARNVPWLMERKKTMVNYIVSRAIRLALVFLPNAVKLDTKMFDKWILQHRDDPLLNGEFEIDIEPSFVITSDLTPFLEENYQNQVLGKDQEWLSKGLSQNEPPNHLD
jgi:hypothetical protein